MPRTCLCRRLSRYSEHVRRSKLPASSTSTRRLPGVKCTALVVRKTIGALATADVGLYLNRRTVELWPFTALNSWTGSLSAGFKSCLELHLNLRQPRFFEFAGQFSWRARVIISRKRQY